jgi:hypothetical protein
LDQTSNANSKLKPFVREEEVFVVVSGRERGMGEKGEVKGFTRQNLSKILF